MHRAIVVFEVEGGSDKGPDGHRRDTLPIVESIVAAGWRAEVIYYRPELADGIFEAVVGGFGAYISRVNPGSIPGGEAGYFGMLARLADAGVIGMSTPADMMAYGAKDALVKLNRTSLVPTDTAAYYDVAAFRAAFPTSLSFGDRVLKQNRGSTGEGIWRVRLADKDLAATVTPGTALAPNTEVRCTEAVDNRSRTTTLGGFMDFCGQYLHGDGGMLVDMRFMPRIVEGEIRILLVGAEPVFIVHKKPAGGEDSFSATLFSGARYTYHRPQEWPQLLEMFEQARPVIAATLGHDGEVPLLWTADFMLDTAVDGSDAYVLGEINSSCVGFTSELNMGIQDKIAAEAIRRVETARLSVPVPAPV